MPEISVIVPVYKTEAYLDRCVRSIAEQSFGDIEILLVDDGSPDASPLLCDEWAARDGRVRVIHKENGGVSDARNHGIERARGAYIAFVDSDDWLEPDALEYLYGLLRRFDADFSMAGLYKSADMGVLPQVSSEERSLTQREFLKLLFKDGTQEDVQYPCGKLYKRELFETVRFPAGVANGEDVTASFELALRSRTAAAGTKIVYHYFCHPESVTSQRFGEKNFHLLTAWELVCRAAEENGCDPEIRRLAALNRKRADFGVLCNLALSPTYDEDRKLYREQAAQALRNMKKNAGELLRANIPLSRKLILCGFCVSYRATARCMNLASRLAG